MPAKGWDHCTDKPPTYALPMGISEDWNAGHAVGLGCI